MGPSAVRFGTGSTGHARCRGGAFATQVGDLLDDGRIPRVTRESYARADVLEFYRQLPFNLRTSAREHARSVRERDSVSVYPVVPPLLGPGVTVLDVGCGAGWLGLGMAYHYGARVTGIDFNRVAVERARKVATCLDVEASFEVADLFGYEPPEPFDLVVSVGVLHHTDDCLAGLRRCAGFVGPKGHLLVGLYHRWGRRPFLELFARMREAGADEDALRQRYRELHSWLDDEVQLESWFRDQVLHPHETQHTLAELAPVLADCGLAVESTSINRFQPHDSIEELLRLEPELESAARERLAAGTYLPGFFIVLARRTA